MANQETLVDTLVAIVDPGAASVKASVKLSAPTSGGWSMALASAFVKGGNGPEAVEIGSGAQVAGKTLEVSAVMKNISATAANMSLQVDVLGKSRTITATIPPGHSAHYSMVVAFVVKP